MGETSRHGLHGRRDLEHALKHLHESEYAETPATTASLAGATGIPLEHAGRLAGELSREGLAHASAAGLRLTDSGRKQARRIVRAHRLYETYLAHHTGIASDQWHRHADHAEHLLSPEDADALADQLGRPRYDPHGDPIPTREGALPPRRGMALLAMNDGTHAEITHVEDEPEGIFRRAVAMGLTAGTHLQIIGRQPGTLRLLLEGCECELPWIVADAILATPCAPPPPMRTLSTLHNGEAANVIKLSPSIVGGERRRLLDLGLVPGTRIERDFDSMLGSPTAYRVRGATIALRKEQADRIFVEA